MSDSRDRRQTEALFSVLPEGLFSPLSRKYRAIYAYALITLYHCLKLYNAHILRADYMEMLRAHGQDLASLFSIRSDMDDDRDGDEDVNPAEEDGDKFAYIVRKLSACGWFQIIKDYQTHEELIFLPAYSIKLLEVLADLATQDTTYIPLVHQTYSELKLEDEKEDEYMYRTLANAVHNSQQLELFVTLLYHSIVVYNHRLVDVSSPNEALQQHFDDFRTHVSEPIYHPMKTYDSFGLYSRPIVAIVTRWLRDERVVARLASQARLDPAHLGLGPAQATDLVIQNLNYVIDVFNRINKSFNEIDRVNSDYTEAVQRKVNYLSGTDKSVKGKLEKIIASVAKELRDHPGANEENSPLLGQMVDTISPVRVGILRPESLYMPFRRELRPDEEPLSLADDLGGMDDGMMEDFLNNAVSPYSEEVIEQFMRRAFAGREEITSLDIPLNGIEDLVLLILAIVQAEFGNSFFTIERKEDTIEHCGYRMPMYRFTIKRKEH